MTAPTERRLGKGLGSLLGSSDPDATELTAAIGAISPNPMQPRREFDVTALDELADSIRRHGVLQPIVVRRVGARFQIISGERRWRASRLAGLEQVPITIRENVSDQEMLELALVENLQRADLNPIERAKGFDLMVKSLGLTQEQVAQRVGLKRTSVTNHLRLLELPHKTQDAVSTGLIQMGHARALLGIAKVEEQLRMMEEVVRDDLSVREVEARVRRLVESQPTRESAAPRPTQAPAWIQSLERALGDRLGTKVRIRNQAGYRGSIVIEYYDRASLDSVVEKLAPTELL